MYEHHYCFIDDIHDKLTIPDLPNDVAIEAHKIEIAHFNTHLISSEPSRSMGFSCLKLQVTRGGYHSICLFFSKKILTT